MRRTETFSDAVFAINITLIGLELRLPSAPAGHLMAGLQSGWLVYLAYLTSFLSLAVAWINHRAIFARIGCISLGVTWMNIGLLLTVGLVPFLTRVVVEALGRRDLADIRAALLFCSLVGVLIATAYLTFSQYLSRHPELLEKRIEQDYFRRIGKRSLVGLFGYAAAGLLHPALDRRGSPRRRRGLLRSLQRRSEPIRGRGESDHAVPTAGVLGRPTPPRPREPTTAVAAAASGCA